MVAAGEKTKLETGIYSIYRRVAGMVTTERQPEHCSNEKVIATLGVNAPMEMVRANRLRYAKRLLHHGPDILWALLKAEAKDEDSWIAMIREDCRWLQEVLGAEVPKADPEEGATEWADYIKNSDSWKAKIKRSLILVNLKRKEEQRAADETDNMLKDLKKA